MLQFEVTPVRDPQPTGATMSTSNRAVAEAFSSHRFSETYDRLADDV